MGVKSVRVRLRRDVRGDTVALSSSKDLVFLRLFDRAL